LAHHEGVSSSWRVYLEGTAVRLVHAAGDDEGPLWSGLVEIWRGAPGADSHPEIEHAFRAIEIREPHQDFIRHRWTWEIPDYWENAPNFGEHRRYLILQAAGGSLNWTLVLRLSPHAPRFVWTAICAGFNAVRKENSMKPTGPDQVAKTQSMSKGEVPAPKTDIPAAAKDGAGSVIASK
jgi:hypothetical protein